MLGHDVRASTSSFQRQSTSKKSQQQQQQQMFYQQQYKLITEWLQELLGTKDIPPFELNPRTLHLLSQLALHCRRRTKEFYIVGRELQRQCAEYCSETAMLDSILQRVSGGNSSGSDVQESSQSLSAVEVEAERLARVAADLQLRDVQSDGGNNTMLMALCAVQDELDNVTDRNREVEDKLQEVQQQSQNMTHRLAHLEKLHAQLVEQRDSSEIPLMKQRQAQITQYFHPKQSEYNEQSNELKRQLTSTGYDHKNLRHNALADLASKMESLHTEIVEPKRAKLRLYHKLPADLDLAHVELEEKRQLKLELDSQIQRRIQNYEN